MKIEIDMTHEAPPQRVFEVLTNPEFIDERCKASGALSFTKDVAAGANGTVVTVDRAMPVDDVPDLLANFVRGGVKIHEVLNWGPADAKGARTAQITLDFLGQPMKLNGTMQLTPTASGSALALRAELKASLPLIGGKIEKATAPIIIEAIKDEETLGREWLAADR